MQKINTNQLNKLLAKKALVIDTCSPTRYVARESTYNIPVNIIYKLGVHVRDKATPLIFVGEDAEKAMNYAFQLGYSKLYILDAK